MVVVAIVLVLMGLVVPSATTMWNERKSADAINTLQGLLMTSRARAMQSDGVEMGFFAYLDEAGVQHLISIEQPRDQLTDPEWQNIFVISEERDQTLPAPMRVVPRSVVDDPKDDPNGFATFSDEELANDNFTASPSTIHQAQRHRNFFTVIFGGDGQLLVDRDVLIQDRDDALLSRTAREGDKNDYRGDRTGLTVSPGDPEKTVTLKYYARDPSTGLGAAPTIAEPAAGTTFPDMIVEPSDPETALNFPSVDGLLVYDESLYTGVPVEEKRNVLLRAGKPLYVSRWTGVVIRGPVGENVTP